MNYNDKIVFSKLHKNTLEKIYILFGIFSSISLITNSINQRPIEVISISIISALVSCTCYFISKYKDRSYVSKIIFLIFYSIIYIPYAWFTSPGSISAMPLFSLIIISLSVIFVERPMELIFQGIAIIEVIVLFYLEYTGLIILETFATNQARIQDVGVNFALLAVSVVFILYRVNSYYLIQHEEIYLQSVTDELTGVYNRRYLIKALTNRHENCKSTDCFYTVAMIDINNFKKVNDIYGHLEGDYVLKQLGIALLNHTRAYDICGRFGGDEFLVVLSNAHLDISKSFCKRVTAEFEELALKYPKANISLAIGIASSENRSVDEIIDAADQDLYLKKKKMKVKR